MEGWLTKVKVIELKRDFFFFCSKISRANTLFTLRNRVQYLLYTYINIYIRIRSIIVLRVYIRASVWFVFSQCVCHRESVLYYYTFESCVQLAYYHYYYRRRRDGREGYGTGRWGVRGYVKGYGGTRRGANTGREPYLRKFSLVPPVPPFPLSRFCCWTDLIYHVISTRRRRRRAVITLDNPFSILLMRNSLCVQQNRRI